MNITVINLTSGRLSSGYQKYLRSLIPLLASDPRVGSLTVLSPAQAGPFVSFPGVDHRFWPAGSRGTARSWIRSQVVALGPDVVFIPTARWIDCGFVPVTIMVRNMEPLLMPTAGESPQEIMRNFARREVARRSCQRAQRVIAVSAFVRDFLAVRWKIPQRKLSVVYHGVIPAAQLPERRPEVLRDVSFDAPFLFTAGSIRPARGLKDAIEAMGLLKAQQAGLKLVIAGGITGKPTYQDSLRRMVARHDLGDTVCWAGNLGPEEIAWCFRKCASFLMTSRVEACPNTALEALAAGAITVSNGNPPMPEFFESAALYYDAGSATQLAAQISRALSLSEAERSRLRSAAIARAAEFTWRKTADRTIAELQLCRDSGEAREVTR